MSLLPYLYDVQRPFSVVDREDRDFLRPNPLNQIVPREFFERSKFMNPWQNMFMPLEQIMRPIEQIMRPMEQLANAMNQLAVTEGTKISSDGEKFQVNIDVQHFSPDEISVKVVDRHVVVEGKHEEKRDEHGYVSRQFVRRYALPQGCLPDTVESKLSSDGVLSISAPLVLALPSTGEKIVPIVHTGPIKKQIGSPEATQAGEK